MTTLSDLLARYTEESQMSNFYVNEIGVVSVASYGAVGDGATDDTQAIRDAIEDAVDRDIGIIYFPYGENGVYLCTSSIVNNTTLGEGLTFVATGKSGGNDSAEGVVIKYTGTGVCWNIQESLGTAQKGNYCWENFTFQCTNVAGTMFAFNDVSTTATDDATTQNYIREVAFKHCSFWGAETAATTGNAIQGLKVFELDIDENCQFRGWKRAIYLKGCDNNTIRGRYTRNGRHIMLEASGTFGNANVIDSRFLGAVLADGVGLTETAYMIHTNNSQVSIHHPFIEGDCGAGANLYLNGAGINIYDMHLATIGNTWLETGASAVDIVFYSPRTFSSTVKAISFGTPAILEWGTSPNQSYKITFVNPTARFERWLTPHPLIKVVSASNTQRAFHDGLGNVDIFGEGIQRYTLSAFNLERARAIGGYAGFISGFNSDTSSYNGYSVSIPASNGSFVMSLIVGKDIQPNQRIRLLVRYKNDNTPGVGSLRFVIQINEAGGTNSAIPVSTSYTTYQTFYTASTVVGDELTLGVYNTSDKTARVSAVMAEIVPGSLCKYGTDAPSSTGEYHNIGEMVFNTAPTATENIVFWHCISDGTPGTWFASGHGIGATSQRSTSLGTGDAHYTYHDTTIGKVITWTGSAWST